ncbi:MAG: TIM barrel protein [Candidatus Diapherotrites archaeon]|nr:TIM barrel protein [Candidatus Diapherotrites archaeon]
MNSLVFGTAGIPLSTNDRNTENGIKEIRNLSLNAMELEFVQNVNISIEKAPVIRKIAEENNVTLTCHGQYFINLNALEIQKQKASIQRIVKAATVANACGAYSMCFHPGFYLGKSREETYALVKKNLIQAVQEVKDVNAKIWVRPEVTGKHSQFGDLDELLKLSSELDQVLPCIDFSHVRARANGKMNSYAEFCTVLEKLEKSCGKQALKNLHCHVQGVKYSEKGEQKHLIFSESDFNYSEIIQAFYDFKCAGVIICESPNLETDALTLQKEYLKLK